jgi:hypothetical protein
MEGDIYEDSIRAGRLRRMPVHRSHPVAAQTWPGKPIGIVGPTAPGGSPDVNVTARTTGKMRGPEDRHASGRLLSVDASLFPFLY